MGQVIVFPVFSVHYPNLAADPGKLDSVLLIAIRRWAEVYRAGEDPIPRLCHGLGVAGAHDATFSVDTLIATIARVVWRPIEIHRPRCPNVSQDEKHLLRAASLTQAEDSPLAEKVLRTILLSADGAALAIGALDGIGRLFAQARLLLSRRPMSECQEPVPEPPPHFYTLH